MKVTYTVGIGPESRSREFELIANRPFIPLVVDVPASQELSVSITGLPSAALERTRVYVYNADHVPYDRFFDPAQDRVAAELAQLRSILAQPDAEIDLGKVKLTVDNLVNPKVDIIAGLGQIDAMVRTVSAMRDFGPSPTSRVIALQRFIYTAGAWNKYLPFEYDLGDPLGLKLENKFLSTYLSSRKGNCVTMPLLFVILGQRLGLDVTATTAPNHLLVKFRNEAGTWINLEATSGANPARDIWIRQQNPTISDTALENGIYLKPLTKKEVAVVIAWFLAEHYFRRQQYQHAIATADLLLGYYPKGVAMMTLKGAAYGRLAKKYFVRRFSSPTDIPPAQLWYYQHLSRNNASWFAKAEALGWREETKDEQKRYLDRIQTTRQSKAIERRRQLP